MKHNKSLLVIGFFICTSLFGMDEPALEKTEVPLQGDELVFALVLHHSPDHSAICSLAQMNKMCQALVCATAQERKNRLLKCLLHRLAHPPVHLGALIHNYGSARRDVYENSNIKQIVLVGQEFVGDKGINCQFKYFSNFISPLPHKPAPFFDKEGIFCFYGYGTINVPNFEFICRPSVEVVRYDLTGQSSRCVLSNVREHGIPHFRNCGLKFFMAHPVLLKTLLNSKIVTKKSRCVNRPMWFTVSKISETYLQYSLDGVTLPDNYMEKITFSHSDEESKLYFTEIPDEVEKVIKKRYEEQSKGGGAATP